MSLAFDVVVMDRAEVQRMNDEAGQLLDSLRYVERIAHNATDDRLRAVYAEIRTALGCGRWLAGGLSEALG